MVLRLLLLLLPFGLGQASDDVNPLLYVNAEAEDQCKLLLDKFSNSSSDFTRCANQYAKPILMCRKCVGHFLNVRTYYHALEHSETDGMNCKSILTSQDKVEIVKATFAFIGGENGLWSKGFCSSCFTRPLTHQSKLTIITNEFFALAEAVLDCFDEHPNATDPLDTEEQGGACTACRADYLALNHFYREKIFQAQFPQLDGICFDILDMMNSTQRRWGREHYGCVRKMHGNAPLILAIILILLTPAAFYGAAWYFGKAAVERAVTTSHITDLLVDITADGHGTRIGQDQVDGWNGHEHGWER